MQDNREKTLGEEDGCGEKEETTLMLSLSKLPPLEKIQFRSMLPPMPVSGICDFRFRLSKPVTYLNRKTAKFCSPGRTQTNATLAHRSKAMVEPDRLPNSKSCVQRQRSSLDKMRAIPIEIHFNG